MAKELTGQEVISELVTRLRARFTTNQFKEVYKDKPVVKALVGFLYIFILVLWGIDKQNASSAIGFCCQFGQVSFQS